VLSVQDPSVEGESPGPKDIPWAGRFRGQDGAKKYFALIDAEAEIEAFEPDAFVAQGDLVVVFGHEKVRSKRTGRAYESHWAHAFTLSNGKIVKYREYTDTAAVAAAFRKE
jgi:ketosteroid isomerase-like protein